MHTFHDLVTGGHSGYLRTYKHLIGKLYWKQMKADVKKYVEECMACQQNKTDSPTPTRLLQPSPILEQVWDDLTMDFVEGLPKARGYDSITVVVDRLSKYAHFVTLSHLYTAKQVAEIFIQEVVRHYGIPKSIISNRKKIFLSHF